VKQSIVLPVTCNEMLINVKKKDLVPC
jgi:hypothetical protein